MGRKKSKTKPPAEPQWDIDDEHRMLGCLDSCLSTHESDRRVINEHISRYLQGSVGKKFGVDRVNTRLRQIQDLAREGNQRQSIFSKGSGILKGVNRWKLVEIKKYKEDFTSQRTAMILGPQGRGLRDTPQRARSRPTIPSRGSHVETRNRSSRVRISVTPTPRKRKWDSISTSRATDGGPGKRRQEIPPRSVSRTMLLKKEYASPIPSGERVIPDSDGHSPDQERVDITTVGERFLQVSEDRSDAGLDTITEYRLEQELQMLQAKYTAQVQRNEKLQSHLQEVRSQLQEVKTIHVRTDQELFAVKARCADAKETIISLEQVISEVDHRTESQLKKSLLYQEKKIGSLELLLKQIQNSATFANLSVECCFKPSAANIQETMVKIHSEIRKLTYPFPSDFTLHLPHGNTNHDLYSLLRRSLGLHREPPVAVEVSLTDLEHLGLEALVCATTAAALCEWIFENEFEGDATRPSLLLDMYRHHVLSADGKLALRNLDLAAHHSSFSREEYRQIQIPVRAESLATRLSTALAPLFGTDEEYSGLMWGLKAEEWHAVHDGLKDIFKLALSLKADLLASSLRYILVFVPPRSEFSDYYMKTESSEKCRITEVSPGTTLVRACIMPAIFAYDKPTVEPV